MNENVIALDGPAGSGKSTVARKIAETIGFNYLDTGAFYRALTLSLFRSYQKSPNNRSFEEWVKTPEAERGLSEVKILCEFSAGKENKIFLNGEDVSLSIRTPEITREIKHIANRRIYRDFVNEELHSLAKLHKLIMDGRDIGTEVFPDAKFKFYLTASSRVRADRRFLQLQEQGIPADRDEIEREIILRDKSDMEREIAPLYQAKDAFLIDTDLLSKNSVISKILEILDR
ncbi:(d)CMP kinase [Leptospira gomenensis]|uniref:Cytidylate kinase n=1 Tax=Leptospira gomenensis TaxID=2484974 RepID=A0A5F1YU30_9LEPT|nr:(d)CMP kinase [Leptospira gomenensis]TGK31738.1 (d)CMP kinase [Leptospira gomenensis]TGK36117.1 (d)CMP kinase [Leptospira gomenensis]TGK41634.1 (d)CMP kinase [Leptospira gomenensis]TGK61407.1 (d)CMP kinase [Leptospira gomenensis]